MVQCWKPGESLSPPMLLSELDEGAVCGRRTYLYLVFCVRSVQSDIVVVQQRRSLEMFACNHHLAQ